MTTTAEFRLVSQLLSVGQRRPHVGAAVLLKPLGCLALGVEHHQLDPVRGHVFGELGHLLVVAELHHVIQAVHFKAVDVQPGSPGTTHGYRRPDRDGGARRTCTTRGTAAAPAAGRRSRDRPPLSTPTPHRLGWVKAAEYVVVSGKPSKSDLESCWELGATVAAGLME